jgi:hypothetical protein
MRPRTQDQSSWAATDGGSSSDDERRFQLLNQIDERIAARAKVALQAAADVGEVANPVAEPGVALARENLVQLVDRPFERPVGVQPLGADQLVRALRQERVVEHEELRSEDRGLRGPDRARHARRDFLELHAGPLARRAQALAFALDAVRGEAVAYLLRFAYGDDRTADGRAGRHATTRQCRHGSSNPLAVSPHNAATASASSGPSAMMRSSVPRAADSSSNPRMLLPSIVRSPRVTLIWLRNWLASFTNLAAARACSPSPLTTFTCWAIT